MGARTTSLALKDLAASRSDTVFQSLVLAAPDIDAQVFRDQVVPRIRPLASHVTLYASDRDKPLWISRLLANYPRAGSAGANLVVLPSLETIDASRIDTDFLGHSYAAESKQILDDLFMLIRLGKLAAARNLRERTTRGGTRYWELP